MIRFRNISVFVILLSVMVLGCSFEPSRYVVSGTVTIDGAPAPYVVVTFHPSRADSLTGGSGKTEQDGKFTIGQNGKNVGFPSGDYKVTFSQTLVNGKPTLAGSGGKAAEKEPTETEAVADEFRDVEKTPITAKVGSGTNNFTFDIKAKK